MRVALSGGIASGKTTVSNALAAYDVPVVDTDIIAREVVEPGTDGLKQVVKRFGDSVLDDTGQLIRLRLREIIFSEPNWSYWKPAEPYIVLWLYRCSSKPVNTKNTIRWLL